jgi:hypothetical protein
MIRAPVHPVRNVVSPVVIQVDLPVAQGRFQAAPGVIWPALIGVTFASARQGALGAPRKMLAGIIFQVSTVAPIADGGH